MWRCGFVLLGGALGMWLLTDYSEGRGRGGAGGFSGGRPPGGGFSGGRPPGGGGVVGPYSGGAGFQQRTTSSVVGPRGGSYQGGSKSGSYTTKGGSTINYGGVGYKGTTGGGTQFGKGAGGVQVTTPGGSTYTKVGKAGGAVGPGGSAIAGKSSIGVGTGPGGNKVVTGNRSGTAIGPGGVYHGASKGSVVNGPYGSAASFSRYTAGPGGAVGHRTAVWSGGYMHTNAVAVRSSFGYHHCFNNNWYAGHPYAWRASAWTAAAFWTGVTWGRLSAYCGYPFDGAYYDYGTNVYYVGDQVYINGEFAATAEQYVQQAETIVQTGTQAKVSEKDEWEPLGVFAMVQGAERDANNLFQLAINKDGIIRGNYYNGLTDTVAPVQGAVNKATQRAAWTVGDRKDVIYETGINNLTQPETAMLVHFGRDRTQQWLLVRQDPPSDQK